MRFPKPYRDCFAVHEAFRRLGFDAEQLFVGFGEVSGRADVLHIQLQAQGKTFTVIVGLLPGAERADVFATWQVFALSVAGMREEDLQGFWNDAPFSRADLVFALHAKGFAFPRSEAAE